MPITAFDMALGAALFLGEAPLALEPQAPLPKSVDKSAAYIAKQRDMLANSRIINECYRIEQGDAIVVCGRGIDQSIKTIPRPEMGGPKHVRFAAPSNGSLGAGVTITGCFLQKCPRKLTNPNLAAFPEPATGTDGDLISRGEMRDR